MNDRGHPSLSVAYVLLAAVFWLGVIVGAWIW